MNKRFLLLISFMLCIVTGTFAEDITIAANSSTFAEETAGGDIVATSNGVEFRYAQANSTSAIKGGLQDNQLRIYKSSTLTISSTRSIQKIVITSAPSSNKYAADGFTAEGYSYSSDKKIGTWEGSATSVTLTASVAQVRMTQIVVTLEDDNVAVKTPAFTIPAGEYTQAQTVGITCATADAKIYYTLDGTDPSEASTEYTAPFEVATTTTVKAIAIKGADKSNITEAKYTIIKIIANTQETALTVAQALELIKTTDEATLAHKDNKMYVKGVVLSVDEIDTGSYGNATYTIADATDATEKLIVYRGYYLKGAKFTAETAAELTVGKQVVVYGTLVNFKGNTPEFTSGNQLVSISEGTAIKETALKGVYFANNTLVNENNAMVYVYNLAGTCIAQGNGNIDLAAYANGIYLLRSGKQTMKIIKR